ncbi:hypothetical protein [Aeromonas jandaei]|uniref:hypothetical protein n=1 Tax=Aeromonas jandaei TaxID=650 RepID=UPI003BA09577
MSINIILSQEEDISVMSHKKGISVGIINVPIQVFSALSANIIIINEIGKGNLEMWYLLMSTMPLFSALELSFPSLMMRNLNRVEKTKLAVRKFLIKAITLSSFLQLMVIVAINTYIGTFEPTSWLFFLGAYLRTIANILISVPYCRGFILYEKAYRASYASLLPILVLALFSWGGSLNLFYLYTVWGISSLVVFSFSVYAFYKSEPSLDSNNNYCHLSIPIKFKENLSLLATTLPGLFIFNLSIYYLKAFADADDVVIYGFILQLVNVYYLVNNIFPSVFSPSLSKLFFARKDISNDVLSIVDCNILLAILALIFIFFLGEDILGLLFSSGFNKTEIRSILNSISIFILIESIQVTLTFLGISTGKYNYHYQSLCSAIIVTVFSYILIPKYGYLGLVYSVCIAQILTCLPFNTYMVCQHLSIPLSAIYMKMIILCGGAGCLFLLKMVIQSESLIYHLLVAIIVSMPVLISIYKCIFTKMLRISPDA